MGYDDTCSALLTLDLECNEPGCWPFQRLDETPVRPAPTEPRRDRSASCQVAKEHKTVPGLLSAGRGPHVGHLALLYAKHHRGHHSSTRAFAHRYGQLYYLG